MGSDNRFKQGVVVTIAKRAANRCSNPDCGALTSGPTEDPSGAINVGEAAHIYGANPGSARYQLDMESADRSAITNAIWLCANCHKTIDNDETRYPAGLLFEWQRSHERRIGEIVGKAGAELRHRYEQRHLDEFGKLSYLAERLIVEKGVAWEYRLMAEILRFEMAPILRRWQALKRGMYLKPKRRIEMQDFVPWILMKGEEAQSIAKAFSELVNVEFPRAWGEPGVAGSDVDIVDACRLFAGVCESAIAWEEEVRFTTADKAFRKIQSLYFDVAGRMVDEASKLPTFMAQNFAGEIRPGKYQLSLTLSLPENWSEQVSNAIHEAENAIRLRKSSSEAH